MFISLADFLLCDHIFKFYKIQCLTNRNERLQALESETNRALKLTVKGSLPFKFGTADKTTF